MSDQISQIYNDPANHSYDIVSEVLAEMNGLFVDEVFNIGCDETQVTTPDNPLIDIAHVIFILIITLISQSGNNQSNDAIITLITLITLSRSWTDVP